LKHANGEKAAVDQNGVLQIPWPEPLDGKVLMSSLDVILATATSPRFCGPEYPTPETIAEAWIQAAPCWSQYFRQNRKYRICTFEDEAIEARLAAALK